jgi:SAM-dependent MidA family methyltransferase
VLPVHETSWAAAWQTALYGPAGFYRQDRGPAGHFATSTQGGPLMGSVLAAALVRLMGARGLHTLVDVGCGRGELLGEVIRVAPALRCVGVDVVARPDLPAGVEWVRSPGGALLPPELSSLTGTLLLAHEWLDVIPCPVGQVDDHGLLREVLVDPSTGRELLGGAVTGADLRWCRTWWPTVVGPDARPGDRVEVGRSRDQAWESLVSRLTSGLAVAVDYGHARADRPAAGTLTGYREGRQVRPVPDGSCDITAHVAMDSLGADELVDQRTALRRLGVSGATPPRELATSDPTAYLAALSSASAATALTARGSLGDFCWAITSVHEES